MLLKWRNWRKRSWVFLNCISFFIFRPKRLPRNSLVFLKRSSYTAQQRWPPEVRLAEEPRTEGLWDRRWWWRPGSGGRWWQVWLNLVWWDRRVGGKWDRENVGRGGDVCLFVYFVFRRAEKRGGGGVRRVTHWKSGNMRNDTWISKKKIKKKHETNKTRTTTKFSGLSGLYKTEEPLSTFHLHLKLLFTWNYFVVCWLSTCCTYLNNC